METKVIKMTNTQIQELKRKYQYTDIKYNVAHTHFQIKGSDFTITAYKSGKVVFQADDLSLHIPNYTFSEKETVDTNVLEMSGSDEVGTGDYFGPVTVCAVYLSEADYAKIPVDQIRDTKEMKDDLILEIAPLLIKELKHSLMIVDNEKYNEVQKLYNMNKMKAMLHNQAFLSLKKKYGLPKVNIIDQFAPKDLYYRYLSDVPEVVDNLIFEKKAENKFLAVACAAIIARYAFLKAFEAMEEKYHFTFPKGAGAQVDVRGREFVALYNEKELRMVAKLHFKNTERIITEQ